VKLWDTETGACLQSWDAETVPYAVAVHPSARDTLIAGCGDRRMRQWDARSGELAVLYDHHLRAVNTVTFVDGGDRLITTSDDKRVLVWEFPLPVPIQYIADPSMHAVPAVALHPSGKYLLAQSLDNTVLTYAVGPSVHLHAKKKFTGHVVAGYACAVGASPNGEYVISGDGAGQLWVWNWKGGAVAARLAAHDHGPCLGAAWHPRNERQVATCGWDGLVKLWA
jgi:pre-mRNA-processing factor 17